jgi:D-alanyl-D-alanine carboxypeptidase/D-alanyl-D-alanine-endopeptidase (penicillin-binding protein 4)
MLKSMNRLMQCVLSQRVILINIAVLLGAIVFSSCGTSKLKANHIVASNNHFTGLLVIDPTTNDTLVNQNANKYFTPASNTKIFTLYTALKLLPEKLPALKYVQKNDTLFIEGTGDPTLMHFDFENQTTIDFLKKHKNIALHLNNYSGNRYGPGWAWEDYDTYFSSEVSSLPLFGNVITVTQTDSLLVVPNHFKETTFQGSRKKLREERRNSFFIPYTTDTLQIPFITSQKLTVTLLKKATGCSISITKGMPAVRKQILWGINTDTLCKKMMQESDNFLAEQLMLMASSQLSDSLSFAVARDNILEKKLADLEHPPRWVDGSGLSRYNLFTPNSMVRTLHKMYREFPKERLFYLFPRWNESGTLKNSEGGNAFIIAKSGALGNNYNLSGYLITKSGKVLIFSYMNNHFRVPIRDIRIKIKETLQQLHENY